MNLEPLIKIALVWFVISFIAAAIADSGGEVKDRLLALIYLVCGFGGAILILVAGVAVKLR